MFKKTISIILSLVFMLSICACGSEEKKEAQQSSSQPVSELSSVTETSSVSSNKRPEVTRPTSSESTSSSVKAPAEANSVAGIGVYHFCPSWCKNLGKDEDSHYKEFEAVLSYGYFNSVMANVQEIQTDRFWELCEKYDITVWTNVYTFYNSSKKTLDEFMEPYDKMMEYLKAHPERNKRFLGFHHEENIWRGQTNEDFLASHKEFYTRYGKRNFDVFATGEFMGVEGNEQQIGTSANQMKKVLTSSLKYSTDVSYDSYSVDVRDGAPNGGYIERVNKELPGVVDGKSYYKEVADLLLRITDHPANLWFFPTSYTTGLWGGLNGQKTADEAYCKAMLEYMYELLETYDFKGGLFLYTYQQFSNASEKGLQSHLNVRDENNSYVIRPNETKWKEYSKLIRRITEDYKYNSRNNVNVVFW